MAAQEKPALSLLCFVESQNIGTKVNKEEADKMAI